MGENNQGGAKQVKPAIKRVPETHLLAAEQALENANTKHEKKVAELKATHEKHIAALNTSHTTSMAAEKKKFDIQKSILDLATEKLQVSLLFIKTVLK
jgi:hypothetical protein